MEKRQYTEEERKKAIQKDFMMLTRLYQTLGADPITAGELAWDMANKRVDEWLERQQDL